LTGIQQTLMSKIALDTNILISLFNGNDIKKREIADELVSNNAIISSQVVSEFLNVSKRLLQLSKSDIIHKCNLVFDLCTIAPTTHATLHKAEYFIKRYDLQLFDAIIVASAWESGCTILYSEDMQHNQVIENTLTIANPFV
jgi:predicted nucleic acid-binding protein